MNHFTSAHTVGIPVTDQDRALEFYTKTLGFTLVVDAPLPQLGGRWIVVAAPDGGANLALTPGAGSVDTGIRLGTPDAAVAHQHLVDEQVSTSELLSWPGVPPMFSFRDLDGNTLYVVQD
ncbi:glyoxalase [Kribbella antibiotica]|uniref:Glyoxalase n=1 Tax=Kribbella antibiotica TaxID=190195 RepID=A0A4R4ZQ54_9ACTN|nr:VOC family protein [Kribbella antibiotica]TDD61081.1 glyoxalase [Kribbella antibiotica]